MPSIMSGPTERTDAPVTPSGETRRSMLSKTTAAGLLVWATPTVISAAPVAAAAVSGPCAECTPAPVQFASCQPETTVANGCRTLRNQTRTVCVGDIANGARVLLARTASGQQEPYVDEQFVVDVTPMPTGTTVTRTFRRWQDTCGNFGTVVTLQSSDPCGTTTVAPLNITNMFTAGCGQYSVRIRWINANTPYAWSALYLVPS